MTEHIDSVTEPGETIGLGDLIMQITPETERVADLMDQSPMDLAERDLTVTHILPRAGALQVSGVHDLPQRGQRKRFTKRVPLGQAYLQQKADC